MATKKAAKPAKASKSKKVSAKSATGAGDLRAHSTDELNGQMATMKKEQFNLRFQRANGQVENTGRIRTLRRSIARIQTVLTEQRAAQTTKG